jgi:hypothetical protein
MKKLLLIIATCILCAGTVSAQKAKQNRFEAGAGFAPYQLIPFDGGVGKKYDLAAYLELRRASAGRHFEYGARLDYKGGPASYIYGISGEALKDYKGTGHCISLLAVADLLAMPGKTINPFIGVGAGTGLGLPLVSDGLTLPSQFLLLASPRAGLELFGHLRLSASATVAWGIESSRIYLAGGFLPVGVNVGWVF